MKSVECNLWNKGLRGLVGEEEVKTTVKTMKKKKAARPEPAEGWEILGDVCVGWLKICSIRY